ncbi:hypothetical protein AOLI_G00053400 [Acnodon oligacanthus]
MLNTTAASEPQCACRKRPGCRGNGKKATQRRQALNKGAGIGERERERESGRTSGAAGPGMGASREQKRSREYPTDPNTLQGDPKCPQNPARTITDIQERTSDH